MGEKPHAQAWLLCSSHGIVYNMDRYILAKSRGGWYDRMLSKIRVTDWPKGCGRRDYFQNRSGIALHFIFGVAKFSILFTKTLPTSSFGPDAALVMYTD
jgi:hypothetical protein